MPSMSLRSSSLKLRNDNAVKDVTGSAKEVNVVVAGSLAIDLACDFSPMNRAACTPHPGTSNPAIITQSLGGVGQNVATAIHRLGTSVTLHSVVGNDVAGRAALEMLARQGLETSGIRTLHESSRTAQYVAVNDAKKNLVLAMADMAILEDPNMDFNTMWKPEFDLRKPKWLVVDANWSPTTLRQWIGAAKASGVKVAFEPVSLSKSSRLFDKISESVTGLGVAPNYFVDIATPNEMELSSMFHAARDAGFFDRQDWWDIIDNMGMSRMGSRDKFVSLTSATLVDRGVPQQSLQLLPFISCVLTKLGSQGVLITQLLRPGDDRLTSPSSAPYILCHSSNGNGVVGGVYMRLIPPAEQVPETDILSVNGVGDTFLGIVMAGLTKENPHSISRLVEIAQQGSVMTLRSKDAVSPGITELSLIL
ncbi:hypothetical protein MMC20_000841 [Loxospora ochrophaea]|nr:hypothetical protein [Loxospora ochrophaea]